MTILRIRKIINSYDKICEGAGMEGIFLAFSEEACKLFECEHAYIYLLDERGETLWTVTDRSGTVYRHPWDKGIISLSCMQRRILNLSTPSDDPRYLSTQEPPFPAHPPTSILSVPVYSPMGNKSIGACILYNCKNRGFAQEDEGLLLMMGRHTGIAIGKAKERMDMGTLIVRLKGCVDTGIDIVGKDKIYDIAMCVQRYICDVLGTGQTRLWICKEGSLVTYTSPTEYTTALPSTGIIGWTVRTANRDCTIEPRTNTHYSQNVDICTTLPLVTIPIPSPTSPHPILASLQFVHLRSVFYPESMRIHPYEQSLIDILVKVLGVAIERIQR